MPIYIMKDVYIYFSYIGKIFFSVAEKNSFSYIGKIPTFFHLLIDFDFVCFINKHFFQ